MRCRSKSLYCVWSAGRSMPMVSRMFFFFSSRRRHTRLQGDWSSDVCSSDLPAIGSAGIVLLAAAGWTALASTLDWVGMRSRVPVFSALLLLAVVCSFWNDNHAVRTLDAAQRSDRPDLRAQLDDWLSRHAAKLKDPKARVPLYVVNAEGGGIRAAYWTVTVLGEIQNQHPAFAEHLFSLSGVSGGSLGSAVFVALLAQQREDKMLDVKKTAQAIPSEDLL